MAAYPIGLPNPLRIDSIPSPVRSQTLHIVMKNCPASLCNMIVFMVCCFLVVVLLLPRIVHHRAAARGSTCANRLFMIGLATHNYHSAYRQLPQGTGGTTGADDEQENNAGRLGPLVALLPFIEQQKLWETIANPYASPKTKEHFPPMGPVPWYDATVYQPWRQSPATYHCPTLAQQPKAVVQPKIVYTLSVSSQGGGASGVTTSYVACYGDGTLNVGKLVDLQDNALMRQARAVNRGMFQAGQRLRFRDVMDGLSNTVMFSETISNVEGKRGVSGIARDIASLSENPSLCLAAAKNPDTRWWPQGRGSRWSDGLLATSGFQTVLPPNSPSCTSNAGIFDSVVAASSRHAGGVHVLLADGAVLFVTNQIDCGDSNAPGVIDRTGASRLGSKSPYGLWGAIGTRANREIITEEIGKPAREFNPANIRLDESIHVWRSKNGGESVSAAFVRIIDKKTIELKDADGILHQVPLNTLFDEDIYRAVKSNLMKEK